MLCQAAALAQVEAPRGRCQRRYEQDRSRMRGLPAAAQVAVDRSLRPLVDDGLLRRMHAGYAAAQIQVPGVRAGVDEIVERRSRERGLEDCRKWRNSY